MGQSQRSKCCNSKVKEADSKLTCFKCERILTTNDIYSVDTKPTVKAELKSK